MGGFADHYANFPLQTGTLSLIVAGLAAPIVGALLGFTETLNKEIFHNKKDSYRAQDKIHEFAATFYSMTDVALAGFLVSQLRSTTTSSLRASWIAIATHQVSYLFAAASSFGFSKDDATIRRRCRLVGLLCSDDQMISGEITTNSDYG
jgi:hypothetical protein